MHESIATARRAMRLVASGWCCWPPAGVFALTMGARQTMGLFLASSTPRPASASAASAWRSAFGQLWWGLTQPFAGAVADRSAPGACCSSALLLVALGTLSCR